MCITCQNLDDGHVLVLDVRSETRLTTFRTEGRPLGWQWAIKEYQTID